MKKRDNFKIKNASSKEPGFWYKTYELSSWWTWSWWGRIQGFENQQAGLHERSRVEGGSSLGISSDEVDHGDDDDDDDDDDELDHGEVDHGDQ